MEAVGAQMPVLSTPSAGRTQSYSAGQSWTTVEEGLLQAIVQRANLPKRSTTKDWTKVADQLARSGEALGYPLRSPSACRNKARSMGLIAKEAPSPAVAATQASFAVAEVRAALAEVLEEFAKKLRGAA